jgi:hypothetical protein
MMTITHIAFPRYDTFPGRKIVSVPFDYTGRTLLPPRQAVSALQLYL